MAARYRAARDPVERSRLQMVWLLVSGRSLSEVAAVTGYSTRWVREVVRRYNEDGPDRLADQRHGTCGAEPLLDVEGRAALRTALAEPPPEGGLWTSAKVDRRAHGPRARRGAARLGLPPASRRQSAGAPAAT